MKIIFMGTSEFALPALEELYRSKHEIIAVYSKAPAPAGRGYKLIKSPIHLFAEEHNIPIHAPHSLRNEEEQKIFASLDADIAVVASYGLILPKKILEAPKFGCLNIHPSLLPRWRGAAPVQRTIMAGDTKTAVAIMQMDEGLDTGPIWQLEESEVPQDIDAGELSKQLAEQGARLLLTTLDLIPQANIKPTPQSEVGIKYAEKISKEECKIDWNNNLENIYNQIRACNPEFGAYFIYNNEKIKIWQANCRLEPHNLLPGTVYDNNLTIATKDGFLIPTILQRPGKNKLSKEEFLRGIKITAGSIFL